MSLCSTSTLRASASAFALAAGLLAAGQGLAQTVADKPPPESTTPGLVRPNFERVEMIDPPTIFCTEREKLNFRLDVWYEPLQAAVRNLAAAQDYQISLIDRRAAARKAGDAKAVAAYQAEIDDWAPILQAAKDLVDKLEKMGVAIAEAKLVACDEKAFKSLDPRSAVLESLEAARAGSPMVNRATNGEAGFGWALTAPPFDGSETLREVGHRLDEVESRRRQHTATAEPEHNVAVTPPVQVAPPVEDRPVDAPTTPASDPQPAESPPAPVEEPLQQATATLSVGPIIDVVRPAAPTPQPQARPPGTATVTVGPIVDVARPRSR